ncbi:DUF3322 domain-containing protein, partial [Fusobacterium necrophorum]
MNQASKMFLLKNIMKNVKNGRQMDLKKWTKINDIKAKIESKWNKGEILRNSLEENNLFPLKIALKVPTS